MLKPETLDYLRKRQRKAVLQECRTLAVIGASPDPQSVSYVQIEKLLGFGLSIYPVLPGCHRYLGVACYDELASVPAPVDITLVFPDPQLDLEEIARQAREKHTGAFWVEDGEVSTATKLALARAKIKVVEHESFAADYSRHFPFAAGPAGPLKGKRRKTVAQRMTRRPTTIKRTDAIEEALHRMKAGHFRHLPVVDEDRRLLGILSDRDLRLMLPAHAFHGGGRENWTTSVEQAAFFDPVTVSPDDTLEDAAEIMLRWNVGALPVVYNGNTLAGIITYTDLLREFVERAGSA